jgi:subtilase family serine protease
LPDLVPFAPTGYADPVVPAPAPGHQLGTLYAGQPTYFSYHFTNSGQADVTSPFFVDLYVDNTQFVHSQSASLAVGAVGGQDDLPQTIQTPGWHNVRLVVNPDGAVPESNTGNNTWQQQFCWEASAVPGGTPSLPTLPHRIFLPLTTRGSVCSGPPPQ